MQRALSRPLEEHIQFLVESNIREVFDRQVNTLGQTSVGTITLRDDSGTVICYVKLKGNKVTNCSYNAIKESRPIYLEPKHALDDLSRKSSIRILEPLVNDLLANEKNQLADRTIEDQERSERVIAIINKAIRGGLVENGSSLQYMDEQFSLISLKNLASGNKTFAVIRRLLENGQFYKNHTLIIDEPEVNLHPAWQLTLANVLVILHKELGLKIFLNSHSPYFVRAVEVYSQRYEIADRCHFYQTRPGNHGMYQVVDVTGNTEQIFRDLYLPLEEL
jgi:predicted ATPase